MTRRGLLAAGGAFGLGSLLAARGGGVAMATGGSESEPSTSTGTSGDAPAEATVETITIGVQSLQEQHVDPHYAVGPLIYPLTWAVSDTLYRLDENAQYIPSLATAYEVSDDQLTWTFTLRDDVVMHDGSRFTAADVKTAVDRVIAGTDMPHFAVFQTYVTGASVVDDTHVQVVTSTPYATLVSDMPAPIPTGYYNDVGDAAFREAPMAAGPWMFVSQSLNSDVRFERFDEFWDVTRRPNWRKLNFQVVPDESSRAAGLKTGDLDIAFGMGPSSVGQFEGDDDFTIVETKETALVNVFSFAGLAGADSSPLGDVNVRRALIMALDREGLAQSLFQGYAEPVATVVPSVMLGYDADAELLPYDVDEAKRLLEEAGASDLSFTFNSYNNTPSVPGVDRLAEAIVSLWKLVGINAELNLADPTAILPAWRAGELEGAALGAGPVYSFYEPSRMVNGWYSTNATYSVVSDADLDALAAEINGETDETRRAELGSELSALLNEQLWGMPLLSISSLAITGPNVASFATMKGCPYAGPLYWLSAK